MPKNCPKCDAVMELVESEPDVGIEGNVYVCTREGCEEVIPAEFDDEEH